MYEIHESNRYFYALSTLNQLTKFVSGFKNPCCLCTPMLGKHLLDNGLNATTLDIDKRFQYMRGFQYYDIRHSPAIDQTFDLIICDPPLNSVSLSQLAVAIGKLACNDYRHALLISYPRRRRAALEQAFDRFRICATGCYPQYQTAKPFGKHTFEFFSNLSVRQARRLRGP